MLLTEGHLFVIDHESAFSPILKAKRFSLNDLNYELFYQHVLFSSLHKEKTDYSRLINVLGSVTEARVLAYIDALPDEWKQESETFKTIADYLKWMILNRQEICRRIADLLG